MLDLTLKELKENIYTIAEEPLCKLGFKGNKSKMQFLKKSKERIVLIEYDFNHYHPIEYQFTFGVTLKYPILIDEVQNFFKTVDAARPAQWNVFLKEGDFVENQNEKSEIVDTIYYNIVTSKQQSIETINASLRILTKKTLLFADNILTLREYQDFCINNIMYFKRDLDIDTIASILIACKMKSNYDYEKIAKTLEDFLLADQRDGTYREEELYYLSKLKSYIKGSNY